jgi:hypothetical protein
MGAMRGRESVVDIEIANLGNGLDQFGVVLFLARPETGVFQQGNVARAQNPHGLLDHIARHFGHEHHFAAQHLFHCAHDQRERLIRHAVALGAAKMRQQQHLGALVGQFQNGRRGAHARVFRHRAILHRQIEIDAHQRDLAGHITQIVKLAKSHH